MTGRWPVHLNELNQVSDGIDLRMHTLADKLGAVGYRNVLVGKTHWGVATDQHLPRKKLTRPLGTRVCKFPFLHRKTQKVIN